MADALEHGGGAETAALESLAPGLEAPAEAAPEAQAEGRKPGARKPTARAAKASIRVRQHPPKPRDPERVAAARERKKQRDTATETAQSILSILDVTAALSLGPQYRMPEPIATGMTKPLQRTIERWDPEANEAVAKWVDPMMLAFYMGLYMLFIWRTMAAEGGQDDQGPGRRDEPPVDPIPPDDVGLEPEDALAGGNHREPAITRVPDPADIRAQLGGAGKGIFS